MELPEDEAGIDDSNDSDDEDALAYYVSHDPKPNSQTVISTVVSKQLVSEYEGNHFVDPLQATIDAVLERSGSLYNVEQVTACVMSMYDRCVRYDDPDSVLEQLAILLESQLLDGDNSIEKDSVSAEKLPTVTESNDDKPSNADISKNEALVRSSTPVDMNSILKDDLRHLTSQPNPREAIDSLYWWIRKNRSKERLDILLVHSSDILATVLTRALYQLKSEIDSERSELKSSLEVLISSLVSCAMGEIGAVSSQASAISSNIKNILAEFCKLGSVGSRSTNTPDVLGHRLAQIFSRVFQASTEVSMKLNYMQLSDKLLDCEKSLQESGHQNSSDLQQLLFRRDKQLEKLELHIEICKRHLKADESRPLFTKSEDNIFLCALEGSAASVVDKKYQEEAAKLVLLNKDLADVENQITLLQSRRSELKKQVLALEQDIAKGVSTNSTDIHAITLAAQVSSLEILIGGSTAAIDIDPVDKSRDDEAILTSLCAFANAQADLVASIATRMKDCQQKIASLGFENVSETEARISELSTLAAEDENTLKSLHNEIAETARSVLSFISPGLLSSKRFSESMAKSLHSIFSSLSDVDLLVSAEFMTLLVEFPFISVKLPLSQQISTPFKGDVMFTFASNGNTHFKAPPPTPADGVLVKESDDDRLLNMLTSVSRQINSVASPAPKATPSKPTRVSTGTVSQRPPPSGSKASHSKTNPRVAAVRTPTTSVNDSSLSATPLSKVHSWNRLTGTSGSTENSGDDFNIKPKTRLLDIQNEQSTNGKV